MEDQRFDELAKRLAKPVSRRQMVKVLAAATVGGWLVRSESGKALAGTCNPNNICAHYCTATFGGNTAASAQCASDAAHCKGACYTCGPMSTGGTKPTCCAKNSSGSCRSYSSTPCCTSPQVCYNGSCCTPKTCANYPGQCGSRSDTCGGTITCACPSPQVCTSGTCCTPNCGGKTCGPDGCGGSCGSCGDPTPNCCNGTCVANSQLCANGGTTCCDPSQSCCQPTVGADGTCVPTTSLCGQGGSTCCAPPSAGITCCNGICVGPLNLCENGGPTCCDPATPHCCNGTCQATPC